MKRAAVAAAMLLTSLCVLGAAPSRPSWTKAKPHFEKRAGRSFAVAVGKAEVKQDRALARAAAEEKARAELLRLVKGAPRHDNVSDYIRGAQVGAVYEAPKGPVYVRLEMPMDDGGR